MTQNHDGLTKVQRKKLKREQKQREREQARKFQEKKKLIRSSIKIGIVILLVAILTYFFFFNKPDASGQGLLRISSSTYDLGAVSLRGGVVSAEIPLVNIGEGDLKITGMDSSCGCTTVSVINSGKEGPVFQMASHGRNPVGWSTVINSGDQASLKIYYNPAVHPNLRGPVTRIVTVYSDDPKDPAQKVYVKVNQVD